ncbi:MAG: transferrin-binding protein-like solute binding protein [Nitrospinae bacterium]|nr:transferrin-binding protein-like solute binding protein [Nitrospinota bacterium]
MRNKTCFAQKVFSVLLSLALLLPGCGGGGGGGGIARPVDPGIITDSPDVSDAPRDTPGSTPVDPALPEQPAIPASLAGYDAYENTAAIDPRDSWKQTRAIESYFELFRYPRHPDPSLLKGTLLGSRNGIYYTQQTSGPADTIDINFLWHTEDVPNHVRGIVERAGKAWSYRLKDRFGPHQLADGVVTRLGRDEYEHTIPYHNDGLLVKSEFDSYFFGGFRTHQIDGDDFMTRSGYLVYSADDASCCGGVRAAYMAAQQIGHALGHKMSEPRLRPENILRYVDYERGLWTGPAVTEANGGAQVSFEEYGDGAFNFNHLAACRMVMSNCGYDRVIPHEMDFAFLKDIGYTIADAYPTDPETYSYKAWADHATWSVTAGRALVFDPLRIDDFIGVKVEVTGNPSVVGFANARSGTVTWNGSLLATDLTTFKPVFGEAEITLSADTMEGTVAFTDLETVRQSDRGLSELTGWSNDRLNYSVTARSDGFQDANGRVMGAFYGPSHEEAAGTLHDEVEKITGAFGGKMAPDGLERSETYVNTAGADPRDTWRPVQPIRSYFELSHGGPHQDPSRLKGTVLGSRNGITYTQQMSGPTDTIDIDFTGYFPNMPDFVQGLLERGGKSWSYRLKDVLGSHQLTDEVVTRLGRDENGHTIPYENDGILVDSDTDYENPAWDFVWGYSRGGIRTHQSDGDAFMVRSAWVELSATDIKCCGDVWAGYQAAHEVGHAIGHAAGESDDPEENRRRVPEHIHRHADYLRGLWTGPALTEANGGVQVPFQRLDDNGRLSPDGELDYGHLGACPMIMSYCGEARMIPHELDFAYMKDIGYTVLDEYPTEPEVYSYGAWADHAAWSVTIKRALFFDPSRIDDYIAVEAGVVGSPSGASFSATHIGTVTWNGSLLAADLTTFGPVFGGAEITLSADTLDGTVAFTDLKTVRKSNMGHAELRGWRVGRLDYSVKVTSNGFQDVDGKVAGALFGPSHEEAAGTLHDEVVRIMGAFGGKR